MLYTEIITYILPMQLSGLSLIYLLSKPLSSVNVMEFLKVEDIGHNLDIVLLLTHKS